MVIQHDFATMIKDVLTVVKNISILEIILVTNLIVLIAINNTHQTASSVNTIEHSCSNYPTEISTMKVLVLNIQSMNTSIMLLEEYVERNDIDLILLSETWNNSETLKFKNWNTKDLFKNREDGTKHGGVAIIPHPRIKIVPRPDLSTNKMPTAYKNT